LGGRYHLPPASLACLSARCTLRAIDGEREREREREKERERARERERERERERDTIYIHLPSIDFLKSG